MTVRNRVNKPRKWDAKDIMFLFICFKFGVSLDSLADYYGVTKQAIHETGKRHNMKQTDLRFTAAQVQELWENGALRFLF